MAYVIKKKAEGTVLSYFPETGKLKSGREVVLDSYKETDIPELYSIFQQVIEEGQTYPQETAGSEEDFRQYYLSHDAFVLRDKDSKEVLGGFYVKPNFPGRSSHICNAGFIVKESCRGQGIAKYMVPKFLKVARDIGFKASFFNLVYVTNIASLKLWKFYGFKEIGRVPKAGNLKGLGFTDAIQFYYDLTSDTDSNDTQK
jgi:L-amino acid N-acyltransferase YncA